MQSLGLLTCEMEMCPLPVPRLLWVECVEGSLVEAMVGWRESKGMPGRRGSWWLCGVPRQHVLVFTHRPASWMAVFNAMPTICFGFQVPVARSLRPP